ncbi:prepilin-type cleavage/methylation domain-containing protein [Sporosarcina sp. P12(2017)]|uniref:type II secretion system protein n=1 Tax=unclassified Sporosarcina TaxID=2647733 RepID=UPI000C17321A|nr:MULTISPECIES: prepilin-type N-terminal cleavage/methylation domain-containing protein [unclassified Sporosarcina]PIC58044.1 prepilin-type cleavage/methylation domain-containing protein [Sporosarcina sp. P10]PIC61396.1 prepilin-type cleavage/methylation domain-containing protein [Sporosarcina sp. P12(2017)]
MLTNNKGLTLVELLGVIVILGIISAIAIPSISNIVVNTRIKSEKNNAVLLINAADLYFIEHFEPNGYINSVGIPTLIKDGYLEDESLVNDTFWIALPQIHPGSAVKQS